LTVADKSAKFRAGFGPEGVSNAIFVTRSATQGKPLIGPATGRFKLCKEHAHPLRQ
jgi:hypothetical protein